MTGYPRKPDEPARARKNWTEDELAYLASKYGLVSLKKLAKNLQRTKGAVYLATKKLLNHQHIYDNFYTANELARLFGIDAKTVVFWVNQEWLRGRRAKYYQGLNRFWVFTEKSVIRLLKNRPWLFDIARMEEHYFRSIIQAEWERDPWHDCKETAKLLGIKTDDAVQRYIRFGWLLAAKKPGGPWQWKWMIRRSSIDSFLANDPRQQHRHDMVRASRLRSIKKDGRPIKVYTLWQFQCPRCEMVVKIMAPPKMFGPEVRQRFINLYVNGTCSHGAVVRVGEREAIF
jgi:hypothetical protein